MVEILVLFCLVMGLTAILVGELRTQKSNKVNINMNDLEVAENQFNEATGKENVDIAIYKILAEKIIINEEVKNEKKMRKL